MRIDLRPTQRAADKWESARFQAFFAALSFSGSQAESRPAHLRLTRAVGRRRWAKAQKWSLRDYMSSLHGKSWREPVSIIGIIVVATIVTGCAQVTNPAPTLTPTSLPTTITTPYLITTPTPTLTATLAVTPDVRTPAPNTVEVVLAVAPNSSEASFAVHNAKGDLIFQTYWPLAREYTIYLPPGEYTWSANAPIPTAPPGCFIVEENSGFWKDGRFTAVKETIEIEVRFVYVVSFCTPTPGTPL